MATTTNYGWTTPDDTALVKDGASAIRTLGSSVDTSVKALSPGTTAGDIDYYTAATTKARVAIGTNGQVLTSNGSVPSWATPLSGSLTLLSTTTLSGTATLVSSISQSYKSLYVLINNPYMNSGTSIQIKPNSTTSVYGRVVGGGATAWSAPNAIEIDGNVATTSSAANQNIALHILDYTNATYGKPWMIWGNVANNGTSAGFGAGIHTSASAITSLQFVTKNGTSTFSGGEVRIYGVN
jgi:hypothetical protein